MKSKKPQPKIRQRQILAFISAFTDRCGYPPTLREIASAVGVSSTATVRYNLSLLEDQGLLKRDPSRPRTYQVVTGRESPAPVAPACVVPTAANGDETSAKMYALQVLLGPDLGHALLNGAQVTVSLSPDHGPTTADRDDATLLGRVVGLTHPL